jgi:hypothetical protein
MDHDRRKMIVMRTITMGDGTVYEKEVEMDLPEIETIEAHIMINPRPGCENIETEKTTPLPSIQQSNTSLRQFNPPRCPNCKGILGYIMPDKCVLHCNKCDKCFVNNNGEVGQECDDPYT